MRADLPHGPIEVVSVDERGEYAMVKWPGARKVGRFPVKALRVVIERGGGKT